jgi:hypothetical protein
MQSSPAMKNLFVALAFALVGAACATSTPPASEPAAPVEPTPTEPQAAESAVCESDADCVVSRSKPNECCDQLCPPWEQAYHKDVAAAIDAWKGPNCAAVSCPVAKCMAPTEESIARCQAGTCTIERQPIASP